MVRALIRDFSELPGYSVSLIRHPQLNANNAPSLPIHIIPSMGVASEWEDAFKQHEQVIIIAPENDSILADWCALADQHAIERLGASLDAIQICSDKWLTAQRLKEAKIPCVPTYRLDTEIPWTTHPGAWVIKPKEGCGCDGVQRLASAHQAQVALSKNGLSQSAHWIAQPWLEGQAASLTILGSAEEANLLSINEQVIRVSNEGMVILDTVKTGSIQQNPAPFKKLVQSVHDAIPGLHGIYGIDLLIQDQTLTVVEINPRITSAYPDLREAIRINPAECWKKSRKDPLSQHMK